MRLLPNLLILFSAGWLAAAETLPPAIETTVRGSLNIEGLTFSVRTFKPVSWASSSQESKYFKVESTEGKTDAYKLSGTFQIPQLTKATLLETLNQESETRWNFHAEICFAEPTELAELNAGGGLLRKNTSDQREKADAAIDIRQKEGTCHIQWKSLRNADSDLEQQSHVPRQL